MFDCEIEENKFHEKFEIEMAKAFVEIHKNNNSMILDNIELDSWNVIDYARTRFSLSIAYEIRCGKNSSGKNERIKRTTIRLCKRPF